MSDVRVRFAPSPTGPLHIGGVRSALYNYLFAKNQRGSFVLRIEDTDRERSEKQFETMILESFDWLGIKPDEGPREGGELGPYRQNERLESYKTILKYLLDQKKLFYCPHIKEEDYPQFAVHWCEFRDGGGETPRSILRFKTPQKRVIVFKDLIRGEIRTDTGTVGDFSVAKNLEAPLYNFANVVDDFGMQITHVLRGEDHIANTPKQILLQEALGYPNPLYGHFPLILGPDRSKLSKRHGPTSILDYKADGYLPEAITNYLALLGWNPGTDQEMFSLDELIKAFSLDKVQRSGAIFDVSKLDWMNGEYIRKKPLQELVELCKPFLSDFLQIPNSKFQIPNDYLENIIALEQPRIKKLSEIGERVEFYFKPPSPDADLLRWKSMTKTELAVSLQESIGILSGFIEDRLPRPELERAFLEAAAEFSADRGALLWPLRAALSGKKASPGPFDIIAILGRDESLRRLKQAKDCLS